MTTTTPDSLGLAAEPPRSSSSATRFLVAFLVGLLLAMAVGVGAMYAYDQQYAGRVLPGVRIGTVDLSGLDPTAAADRLHAEYDVLSDGALVLEGPDGPITIPYAEFGRRADVEAMVADALGIGRSGSPVERAVGNARTAMRGVVLEPRITYDADALADRITGFLGLLTEDPVDASIVTTQDLSFTIVPGRDGRRADPAGPIAEALAVVGDLDAPSRVTLDVPVVAVEPAITTVEAFNAKVAAERIAARIDLTVEDVDDPQSISPKTLRSWISFAPTADGGYAPSIDTTGLPAALEKLATKIDQAPVNASFTTSGGKITGVTPSKDGYRMDVAATVTQVEAILAERAAGARTASFEPTLETTEPLLTTAEAEAARPKMKRISFWTTYFPVSEKNGFGANIWIPARLIDGYVVAPGATFDFWDAVGPVTREKGYRSGGAIINGRTEPQGALAGGICSCSTTLFNAALRAGYEMGARRNHYYYIDRYPLGLDATVFISASGSKQTMSFTNDTKYPILIRGRGWREGSAGYVRFDLYSVPTGREVTIQTGKRQNIRRASDSIQYTSSLPPGVSKRIEYPVDGFQVTAVRIVRDEDGNVIHRDTYYSNYARITGIVLVGKGEAEPESTAEGTPAPTPAP